MWDFCKLLKVGLKGYGDPHRTYFGMFVLPAIKVLGGV